MISPFDSRLDEVYPAMYRDSPLHIDGVVLHYISAKYVDPPKKHNEDAVMRMILDMNRPKKERQWYDMPSHPERYYASYHWLVPREWEPIRLVSDTFQAYHAGKSQMGGRTNLNQWTIGISLINDGETDYTPIQYIHAAVLVKEYEKALGRNLFVWGHNQVSPGRKVDPGDHFDWDTFTQHLNYNRFNPANEKST